MQKLTDALNKKPFYVCFRILVLTGILPSEKLPIGYFYVSLFVSRLVGSFTLVGEIFHFMTIKTNTEASLSVDIAMATSMLGTLITSFAFVKNYRRWLDLCKALTDFSKFGKPAIFDQIQKKSNLAVAFCASFVLLALVCYDLESLLEIPKCKQRNLEKNLDEICAIVPIWLPIKRIGFLGTFIINSLQVLASVFIYIPSTTCIFLCYNVMLFIAAHANHLQFLIFEALKENDRQKTRDKLRCCVIYHQFILKIGNESGYLVKRTIGFFIISGAISVGCLANESLNDTAVRTIMHLLAYTMVVFMICLAGQVVLDETLSISDAIYEASWYTCDPKTMRDIRFMLARSQMPISLPALPIGNLNYAYYLAIMKAAYSYVTLLQNTAS